MSESYEDTKGIHTNMQQKSFCNTTALTIQNSILHDQFQIHEIKEKLKQKQIEYKKIVNQLQIKEQLLVSQKKKNSVLESENIKLKERDNDSKEKIKHLQTLIACSRNQQRGYELKRSRSEKNITIQPKSERYIYLMGKINDKIQEEANLLQRQAQNQKVVQFIRNLCNLTLKQFQRYEFQAPKVIPQGENIANFQKMLTGEFKKKDISHRSNSTIICPYKRPAENQREQAQNSQI